MFISCCHYDVWCHVHMQPLLPAALGAQRGTGRRGGCGGVVGGGGGWSGEAGG